MAARCGRSWRHRFGIRHRDGSLAIFYQLDFDFFNLPNFRWLNFNVESSSESVTSQRLASLGVDLCRHFSDGAGGE